MSLFVQSDPATVMLTDFILIMVHLQKLVRKMGLKCLAKRMLKQINALKVLHTQKGMLFETVDSVLVFEQVTQVCKIESSGSQILLSLYYNVEFIVALLQLIVSMEDADHLGEAAREAYNSTLKCHHPCHRQIIYQVGMHWLPSKQRFMESHLERDEVNPQRLALQLTSLDQTFSRILVNLPKFQDTMRKSLKKRRLA